MFIMVLELFAYPPTPSAKSSASPTPTFLERAPSRLGVGQQS